MKWPKKHFVEEEQRIVKKFAFMPFYTDDGFMVWLKSYWSVMEYRFVIDDYMWVEVYKGSTHFSCKEYQHRELMARARTGGYDQYRTVDP